MQFGVLGSIEVVDENTGDRVVELGGPKVRRLLAALLMSPGRSVSTGRLVEAVWYGEEPPEGASTLPTLVTRLRRVLGAEPTLIESQPGGYVLRVDGDAIDAVRFEGLVEQSRQAVDTTEALYVLGRALGLWRGHDAYEEFAAEEWARPESVRLDELRAAAAELFTESQLDLGSYEAATGELERWVGRWPLRECFRAQQMVVMYRSGRQPEALRAYQEFRSLLGEELGLDPSADLVELERRIATADPALMTPSPRGRALRGFRLHERIGEGTFGLVYRAVQSSVGREVAVKVLRRELADDPAFIRRFETEAQLVARLSHPHIVPLYDYWRDPSGAYLVMRYVQGGSLADRLSGGPLGIDDVGRWVGQVSSALDVAHRSGVVHRDVKPANVLIDPHGNAYLTDFGIAVEHRHEAVELAQAGSPAYASPEQLRGDAVGAPGDIHALGVLVYEAVTGQLPFPGAESSAALVHRVLHDPVPPARLARPELPVGVDAVIERATAKDPADHFATAADLADALNHAVAGERKLAATPLGTATITATPVEVRNPYKGLDAFQEADAGDFFGRDRLVDSILELVDGDGRFAAVVGPSGSGKSSVVRAGVVPEIRRQSDRFVLTMVPGIDPFAELEAALLRIAVNPPATLLDQLTDGVDGLGRAIKRVLPDQGAELMLVIDQFEELYTLVDQTQRRQFLDALVHAVTDPHGRLRVAVTLRADFFDRPLQHADFGPLITDAHVTVTTLRPDELERAIAGPAERVSVGVEPALIAALTHDVTDQPSALPLLQYTLTELFEHNTNRKLTVDSYIEMGGMSGAIARRAEHVYDGLTDNGQAAARRLFGELVNVGEGTENTRRRVRLADVAHDDTTTTVIDRYGEARLLSFDRDETTREPTVEVAHEALIRQWPRLQRWLDEDRDGLRIQRHLNTAARDWDFAGRPDSELYRGGRLEAAEEWAATTEPSNLDRAFLGASIDRRTREQDAQRRANRRLRRLLTGVAVIAAAAIIAGAVALQQRSRANDSAADARAQAEIAVTNEQRAEDQTAIAEQNAGLAATARADADIRRMVVESALLREENPTLSFLLAREAHNRSPGPLTSGGLLTALQRTDGYLGFIEGASTSSLTYWIGFLDDDTIILRTPEAVELYDLETRMFVRSIPLPRQSRFGIAAGSVAGGVFATVSDEARCSSCGAPTTIR